MNHHHIPTFDEFCTSEYRQHVALLNILDDGGMYYIAGARAEELEHCIISSLIYMMIDRNFNVALNWIDAARIIITTSTTYKDVYQKALEQEYNKFIMEWETNDNE